MPELAARAAVLTGEAAVNLAAAGQGMVAGDLVNAASRVQAAAEPSTVLVGESTRRATESSIAYEDAGAHELKGKAETMPLWRALRVTALRAGGRKSEGLEAPFVGRDRELRLLKEHFHASADESKAHLASIVGIAGIGKSRLAWELYKYLDGITQQVAWHSGRCLAYGEGVTYWALAEMVRMRAGIAEGEEPEQARTKLDAALELHVADVDEREWIRPRVAQLLSLEASEHLERADLYGGWRLLFERIAEREPVVLVFEDMQWADAPLIEFVEHLLDRSRSSPDLRAHARPPRAGRTASELAGRASETSRPSRSSLCRTTRWRRSSTASSRSPGGAPDADPGAGGRHPALRGRDRADAARPGPARAGRRRVPADGLHRGARGARDVARAGRRAAGRPHR